MSAAMESDTGPVAVTHRKATRPARARPKPAGRPSNFRPEAVRLAATGMTKAEIAVALRCGVRTLTRWARLHPEFRRALDAGLVQREANRHAAKAADAANRAAAERQQPDPIADRVARAAASAMAAKIGVPLSAVNVPSIDQRRQARRQTSETVPEEDADHGTADISAVEFDDPLADW